MKEPVSSGASPRHPQLDAMIRAAREQSAPAVTVTVGDIRAAASARSSVRWWGVLAAAAVVAVSVWAVREQPSTPAPVVAAADDPVAQPPAARVPNISDAPPLHPQIPSSAGIEPLDGADEPLSESSSPDGEGGVVALTGGRYRIQTSDVAMMVSVAGRVLEVSAASDVVVDARVEHSSFRVVKGDAQWSTPEASPQVRGPSAKQLAAQAEAALLSGRLEDAVRLLRKLVLTHPRGPASKAALIDLARLEKRLGRPGRAHCAYALFSKRFPTDARTPTVRRADESLGHSPRCRGLRPASK